MQSVTLALLDQHRANLAEAILKLEQAGLGSEPPAFEARRYLAKVKRWIADPRGCENLIGENGYAPAIRDVVREAEFYVTRFAPDPRFSAHRRAA